MLEWLIETTNHNTTNIVLELEYSDLFDENLTDAIPESIMEFLKSNKLIRSLNLKGFNVDELETEILFEILTSLTSYQIMELGII